MTSIFLLTILCMLSVFVKQGASGPSGIGSRIIGGIPAPIHTFPFAAAIDVQTGDSKFFCGGTLYTTQWVITAGQCVDGGILFEIHLGSAKLNDLARLTVATSDYVLHPDYNRLTLEHDIGLIKFRQPIQLTDSIKPISYLAIEDIKTHQLRTIGWGQTSDQIGALSEELQYVYVSPLSNSECQNTYGTQITDTMVCVEGNYNEGACHGDTGGALIDIYSIYYLVHVGIASFVSGSGCESTDPSGYTRTLPHVPWIKNVTTAV